MKNKKWLFILAIIMIIAALLYFWYTRNYEKENLEGTIKSLTFDESGTEYLNVDGEKIKLEYSNDYENATLLKLNDEELINSNDALLIKLEVLKDVIVIGYDDNGQQKISVYGKDGNLLSNYSHMNTSNLFEYIQVRDGYFDIEGNNIVIHTSLLGSQDNGLLIANAENILAYCTQIEMNELAKYNINNNSIVNATYEIEYLGGHKFSSPKRVEQTTLGEYKNANNICD